MASRSGQYGGYKGRIAFIPETSVSVVPTLPKEAKATADFVTATGAFTFLESGGKPTPIYATRATVGYKAESQGETDCKSYKISGEFFHPGKKVEAAAFARQICNTPGYLIIEDNESQQLIGQPRPILVRVPPLSTAARRRPTKEVGPSLRGRIARPYDYHGNAYRYRRIIHRGSSYSTGRRFLNDNITKLVSGP